MKPLSMPPDQKTRTATNPTVGRLLLRSAAFTAVLLAVTVASERGLMAYSSRCPASHHPRPTALEFQGGLHHTCLSGLIIAKTRRPSEEAVIRELSHWNWSLTLATGLIIVSFLWSEILRRRVRNQTRLLQEWARREVALKKQYQELFENANDLIFTTDIEGKLTSINKAAEQLTGFSRTEAYGADVSQYVAEEFREPIRHVLDRKLRGNTPTTEYMEIVTKSGSKVPLEVRSCLIYENGMPVGLQGIARDITARRQVELETQKAREAAEAANLAKGEFLANMSHEIRTPLNGILGMTELALNTELTEEQREYVTMARTSGETLLTVINDILDFSKIEAGRLDLNPIDFDVRDTLGDTLKTLSLRAHQKGLEIALQVASDVPCRVEGDPTRLRQVAVNLVSNAIKFTDHGEVTLRVWMESQTEKELALHFSVTDTGIGIPADKQSLIFEPFTQADSSATRRYGGTGLGLAISFQIVELMGGHLWVESEEGKGSVFHFTARFSPSKSNTTDPGTTETISLRGLAALVIDDNATNRRIVGGMLVAWKMRPAMADGGWTGLAAMEQAMTAGEPFPLVLIDACMPGMDGFRLAERIKQNPALAGSTIMMLTSAGRRGDAARCRELRIAAYLHKPIKERDLSQAIILALAGQHRKVKESELITHHTMREQRRTLRVLLAEDDMVNRQLAKHLLRKSGYHVTAVRNGREAVATIQASGLSGYDVVLMDVQMPEMNGLEATTAIRAMEQGTQIHLPVIAMTAHAMKGDRDRFLAAGMDGYIAKPVDIRRVVSVIDEVMFESGEPKPECAPKISAKPAIDWKRGLARADGDSELFHDLLKLFASQVPAILIEIRASVERKNGSAIEHSAHRLKGSLSNFGADNAVAAAARLEAMARDGELNNTAEAFAELEKEVGRVLAAIEIPESEMAG